MASTGVKMAYRLSHNGITMPADELESEHVEVLLSIWHLFQNLDTTNVDKAFGGERQYSIHDQCVKDLFEWRYLIWVKKEESFRLNEGVVLDEINGRCRTLKEIREQLDNQ